MGGNAMPAQTPSSCHQILVAQRGLTVTWRYDESGQALGRWLTAAEPLTDQLARPGEAAPTYTDFGVPRGAPHGTAASLADAALAYSRCRHYDPTPGRWLIEDEAPSAT